MRYCTSLKSFHDLLEAAHDAPLPFRELDVAQSGADASTVLRLAARCPHLERLDMGACDIRAAHEAFQCLCDSASGPVARGSLRDLRMDDLTW